MLEVKMLFKFSRRHLLMEKEHEKYANGNLNGLSDLGYQVVQVKMLPVFTWIHVQLNGKTEYSLRPYNTYAICRLFSKPA